jgi:hypothetical protein
VTRRQGDAGAYVPGRRATTDVFDTLLVRGLLRIEKMFAHFIEDSRVDESVLSKLVLKP